MASGGAPSPDGDLIVMKAKTILIAGALLGALAMPSLAQEANINGTWVDAEGTSFTFRLCGDGTELCGVLNDIQGASRTPENLQFVLERLHDKYKMPIIITENGLADGKDGKRKWWLAQTIHAMQHALSYGVQLEGYFHWSLMDNFEWAHGKWPRFGLIEVDYKTGQRKMRQSAITFSNVIKRLEERK